MPAVSLIIKFNQETNVLYIILIAAFRLNTCLVHLHVPTDHLSVTYLFIFKFYSVTCARTADKEHAVSLQKHCIYSHGRQFCQEGANIFTGWNSF